VPNASTIAIRLKHLVRHGSYIPRGYYVFDDLELVYIPIYKVATTSIKTALIRREPGGDGAGEYPHYMNIHNQGAFGNLSLTRTQRGYFKFAFVRNPFDRLVSCYEDRVRKSVNGPGAAYYFDTDYNQILVRRLFGDSFRADMSFADFVKLVTRIPDVLADGHFKSQYANLYRSGRLIPDFVGKFESLTDDWRTIADRFGLPALERQNPSDRQRAVTYFETSELVEIAAKRYWKDIDSFGYHGAYRELREAVRGPVGPKSLVV
jgi:chondroitin 4-sulfotransferase 11